jgi:hypothetical protein
VTLVDAPFDVAASAVNRAPNSVTAALAGNVCSVSQDLVREDPDYDIVRYRYVWRADGKVVRSVTSAGLADILPRTVRGSLTCTVTPGDGRLSGPAALAAG